MDPQTIQAIWRAKWKANLVLMTGWAMLCWILRPSRYVGFLTFTQAQATFWLCYFLLIRIPFRQVFKRQKLIDRPSEPNDKNT